MWFLWKIFNGKSVTLWISFTRSETRFAGLFARLPVRLVIRRRSPTSMKRDHTSRDLWGTWSTLGDQKEIFGGHPRHFGGRGWVRPTQGLDLHIFQHTFFQHTIISTNLISTCTSFNIFVNQLVLHILSFFAKNEEWLDENSFAKNGPRKIDEKLRDKTAKNDLKLT